MNFFQKIISMFLAFLSMLGLFGKGSTPEIKEGEFNFVLTYAVNQKPQCTSSWNIFPTMMQLSIQTVQKQLHVLFVPQRI